jgi:integrase
MTVWKPKDRSSYRYKFYYKAIPYLGNTGQLTHDDAIEFEDQRKREVRRQVAGLPTLPEHSPTISDWAEVYYKYIQKRGHVKRLDRVDDLLRVVLRFWGARPSGKNPKNLPIDGEPYHDLRLLDPLRDPDWLVKFERWMDARRVGPQRSKRPHHPVSPQTRNHYISMMSRLYALAQRPQFVKKTGVQANPFRTMERYRTVNTRVAVTAEELGRWLQHAPRHAQIAIAIAALAPKLRLANILALRWDQSFDAERLYITVTAHKTDGTGRPLVVPIATQLRGLLDILHRERSKAHEFVIAYRGQPIKSIRGSVRGAAAAAGLTYGLPKGGVTFHTIRHTAATLMAEMPHLTEALRSATMGQDILTTQGYTHLRPSSQRHVLEELSDVLSLDQVLEAAFGPAESMAAVPPLLAL